MLFDRAQLEAVLPQYEVGAQLGRGGFGLVLEGRHRRLGRPVAIKILTISDEPDVERRFLAEAQVMAAFDHPHVVRVHDYAESDGLCLIVMEHLPGGTLTSFISENFPAEQACAIGLAIADALDAAHQRGIVHRDIKPDNVLFAADGAVKVTDFGIAKLFENTTATTGTLMGTPAYAAPEQIMRQRIGPATDVYALGGLLYHLLTGHAPFALDLPLPAMLHYHLTQRPELPAGMPPRIAAIVGQALEKDPAARPSSAKNFALALAAAAAADLGPGWALRAETPLRINDEIRTAAVAEAPPLPVRTPNPAAVGAPTVQLRAADPYRREGSQPQASGAGLPVPSTALIPAPRQATTTSGGRHAAPDPSGGYLPGPPSPVDYIRGPGAEGLSSTTTGGRHGFGPTPGVGPVSGAGFFDPIPGSGAGPVSGVPAVRPVSGGPLDASGRPIEQWAAGPGRPALPAGASGPDGAGDREEWAGRADSRPRVSRGPARGGPPSVGSGAWWTSRPGVIVLVVALIVLLAISIAAGVLVGNARRSSQVSGAPAPTVAAVTPAS
jgi:hypothetical protein